MRPVNNKSLLHFLFDQMEKLNEGNVDVKTALAINDLAKTAHSGMRLEHERVNTLIKLDTHNRTFGTNIELRNIEGKNFE